MSRTDPRGKILFVSDDVFFWARVQGAARALGREAVRIGDEAAMDAAFREGGVAQVIADLGSRSVDVAGWAVRWREAAAPPRLVAYGSHVDEAALAAARAAGYDEVMPNSRFNRELTRILQS